MSTPASAPTPKKSAPVLSLYHLLDHDVLGDPYPLYHRLQRESPVHWDPFLRAWVVTRYDDVIRVLREFHAARTPTPEQRTAMGLESLNPVAEMMVKQMLFLDGNAHMRMRGLASVAFTPQKMEALRSHIRSITRSLLESAKAKGGMDVITDLGEPLPCIVTAEMLGLPTEDHRQLKQWSEDFAEILCNFQHTPDRVEKIVKSTREMTDYFRGKMRKKDIRPDGLVSSLMNAEINGDRLSEDEVIANCMITLVGGQETTTNLIGNGVLTLMRHPEQLERLRADFSLIPSAVEEMLRFESPSQHTGRLAPEDVEMGGKKILKRQTIIAVMAAANRDPNRFPDPDRFDITRPDNKHVAFGWGAHFCFGAPLARIEAQVAFEEMLRRFPQWRLTSAPLVWRQNMALRGLTSLPIEFPAVAQN
jgi:pimeloyl-[acyl-carrier protein] synthase